MTDAAQQEAPRRRKSVSCHNPWCGGSKLCIHCDPPAITEAPARSGGEVTSHASGAVEAAFAQGYDDGYEDCAAGHDKDHSLSWAAHKEALAALSTSKGGEE